MKIFQRLGLKISSNTKSLGLQSILFAIFNAGFYLKMLLMNREQVGIWGLESTFFYSLLLLMGIHVNVSTISSNIPTRLLLNSSAAICGIGLIVLYIANLNYFWFIIWFFACLHYMLQSIVESQRGFEPRTFALIYALPAALFVLIIYSDITALKAGLLTFYAVSNIYLLSVIKATPNELKQKHLGTVVSTAEYIKVYGKLLLVSIPQIFLDPILKNLMPTTAAGSIGNYEIINKGLSQIRTISAGALRHRLQVSERPNSLFVLPLIFLGILIHLVFYNQYMLIHFIIGSILNVLTLKSYYFLLRKYFKVLVAMGVLNILVIMLIPSNAVDTVFYLASYFMTLNALIVILTTYVAKYLNGLT